MKKRVSVFLNFIAFNLLFFALYLNFIHKDAIAAPAIQLPSHTSAQESFVSGAHSASINQESSIVEETNTSKEAKRF